MLWFAVGVIAVSVVGAESNGEKALKSWGELAVGGSWTATINGELKEHTYEWMLGEKFLKLTAKEKESPGISIGGIDPDTKEMRWWNFRGDGSVNSMIMTSEEDGVWTWKLKMKGPDGTMNAKGKVTRVDANTLKAVEEMTVNGQPQPIRESTWTRK